MDVNTLQKIAEIFQALITSLAIIIAGFWALRKYVFQQEAFPRIDFSVDVNFVGQHHDYWVIEILGNLKNQGSVPHQIVDLSFSLRYLTAADTLIEGPEEINKQLWVQNVMKRGTWTPAQSKEPMIILPGVTLRYSYLYWLPLSAKFLLLHGLLKYHKRGLLEHRADVVLKVPETETG